MNEKIKELIKKRSAETGQSKAEIKKQISQVLYPNSSDESRTVLMSLFLSGKTKRIGFSEIAIICDILDVEPNELII